MFRAHRAQHEPSHQCGEGVQERGDREHGAPAPGGIVQHMGQGLSTDSVDNSAGWVRRWAKRVDRAPVLYAARNCRAAGSWSSSAGNGAVAELQPF